MTSLNIPALKFSVKLVKTEMFARFSTVAGERGAADAERDIRGFALKFYTEEGNWDMVGNNTPVFFSVILASFLISTKQLNVILKPTYVILLTTGIFGHFYLKHFTKLPS